ncbi:MAG: hypothetical protein FJ253_08465 [Phycisphaerae bacterium]|nr:hypothetical protein [Phycisphaerae bacterium]
MTAALVNLQMELHALNSMNDAGGQQLDNVKKRISLMNSFIASKNLNDALATFRTTWKPSAVPLSFQQAYSTALDAEHLRGGVIPSTNDVDALATEVSATSTMVHERWNTLNKQLRESQLLTSFLDGKKLMDEYHDYAQKNAASLQAAEDAKAANQATLEKERDAKDNARRQAALTYLQKQWDARSHKASSGIDYDYGFSQGASQAGPFSQTPGSAYSAGTGSTPPTYAPVPVPTAYDYWTGTYFNSYADPYYDVNGYPQGYALEPNAPAGAAYRRAPDSNSPYHPTPAR